MCKIGLRVDVFDGSGKTHLGKGTIIGFVDVYIVRHENGIYSAYDAETKPNGFPEESVTKVSSNPKIKLDSGKMVYGCQTWWEPIQDNNN